MSATEDTYKGESYTKKFARVFLWSAVSKLSGIVGSSIDEGVKLVLASRECGDIAFLLGGNCVPADIVAVDVVPDALAEARRRFPGVQTEIGDIADVAGRLKRRVRHAFVDFCGPVGPKTIDTFFRTAVRSAEDGAIFAIGVMRGRERGRIGKDIAKEKAEVDYLVETGTRDPRLPDPSRGIALDRELFVRGLAARCMLLPFHSIQYHSRSALAGGVPMLIKIYRVYRETRGINRRAFGQRSLDRWQREVDSWNRANGKDRWSVDGATTAIIHDQMTDETVRKVLLDLAAKWTRDQIARPELLLNVSPGTLAAWRAHATRGTYDETEAAE